MTGNRLVEETAEDVVAKVRVRALNVLEIPPREEVKQEPVVALTQDLPRNAAGLLGNENNSQVQLAALFHPLNVDPFASRRPFAEDGLSFLDNGNSRDRVRILLGELFHVVIEYLFQYES